MAYKAPGFVTIAAGGNSGEAAAAAEKAGFVIISNKCGDAIPWPWFATTCCWCTVFATPVGLGAIGAGDGLP